MYCINHFFSPTRKEEIEDTPTKPQALPHNLPDVKDILITAYDIKETESAKISDGKTDNTVTFLKSDEKTNTKFNQEEAEYAENEVGRDKHRQATENDVIVMEHAELEQESVLKSLTTTHISSGRTEQMKCEDEEITHPHDNEISIDTERPAVVKLDDEKVDGLSRKVIHMSVSIESIKKKIKRKKHKRSRDKHDVSVKFRTEIDPAKSQAAEQELRKEISQDMFAKVSDDIQSHVNL